MDQRILVLGATGNTGREVVDLALGRGHRVTAFVRSPQKIDRTDSALTIVKGELHEAAELAQALAGHDAGISALGPPTRDAFRPHTLLGGCAATTRRNHDDGRDPPARHRLRCAAIPGEGLQVYVLQHHLRDTEAMEAVVRATDFEWTIARPPRLVKSPHLDLAGRFRRGVRGTSPGSRDTTSSTRNRRRCARRRPRRNR